MQLMTEDDVKRSHDRIGLRRNRFRKAQKILLAVMARFLSSLWEVIVLSFAWTRSLVCDVLGSSLPYVLFAIALAFYINACLEVLRDEVRELRASQASIEAACRRRDPRRPDDPPSTSARRPRQLFLVEGVTREVTSPSHPEQKHGNVLRTAINR